MRSASVIDRHARPSAAPEAGDLLVLWQHPETREFVPIGRLQYDGQTFTFVYTRAAGAVDDFRPLPGLADLHRAYVSDRIPTVFGQRVMEPQRPDYADYLQTIGLDPEHATPWEQIVHSGGMRAGDTLQFMQVPTVLNGRARSRFLANGLRHMCEAPHTISGRTMLISPEEHESALRRLSAGDEMLVEPEDSNSVDASASLLTTDGIPVGWVPRALSASIRELMTAGALSVRVVRIGNPTSPPHLRLVVDLDVRAPEGFRFDREGRWEPFAAQ